MQVFDNTHSLTLNKMSDSPVKQEDLKWRRLSGQPARTIKEVPLITITSEGTFVYDPENGGFFSKLSKRQMEKVEAMATST